MNEAQKLRNDIGFAKWFINDLMDDPLLNAEQISWMEEVLKKLEEQVLIWELNGFDKLGNQNSFHHLITCQN